MAKDKGEHWLKGIKERVRIYEVLPQELAPRTDIFPPLRSMAKPKEAEAEAGGADSGDEEAAPAAADGSAEAEEDSADEEDAGELVPDDTLATVEEVRSARRRQRGLTRAWGRPRRRLLDDDARVHVDKLCFVGVL